MAIEMQPDALRQVLLLSADRVLDAFMDEIGVVIESDQSFRFRWYNGRTGLEQMKRARETAIRRGIG